MTIFDDIRRDADAGTPGPWWCHLGDDSVRCDCRYVLAEYGGMGSIAEVSVAKKVNRPWGDDNGPAEPAAKANARRIARVPELERIALAAEELAKALEGGVDLIRGDLVGSEWKKGCRGFVKNANEALAQLREATK